jgi:ABC-2 type transport system ATP-binding protein
MIKVEGLTKRYGPTTAVNNISFQVDRGEIVGFLGPNGAGKTTTMRILTGFLPPTLGKASVAGYDVMVQPLEVKKRIGYLPETPPLYPEMEVVEYLDFVARLKGIPSADISARIDSVLERCALGHVRHKIIGHLSRGYRQRVGLAQAMIHGPDVLILDEPTAGLDPKQIIDVRKLIHALSGEHTIILSTHILPEVSGTCNRVLIINEGRLEASDTPENLTARLQGHESLWVDVDGPAAEVEQALSAVPGVNRVTRENGHAQRTAWQVETGKDSAIRSQIARTVVERGWGLFEIRPIGLSLEEIFLKLTSKEEAVEQAALEGTEGPGAGGAALPSAAAAAVESRGEASGGGVE